MEKAPYVSIELPELSGLFNILQAQAIICRFNGVWPKFEDLSEWIYLKWTRDCDIYLCAKGFFVVYFDWQKHYNHVINERPWFRGREGLFVTPWFPGFDVNSMVVSKTSIWVRVHNLPLPFWHHLVLEGIGNSLGRFLKLDRERMEKWIFTFARICVEMDLRKDLPQCIPLTHKDFKWTQCLFLKKTVFKCKVCHETWHLQNTCNQAKKKSKRTQKPKECEFQEPPSWDEEDEENDETQQQPETKKKKQDLEEEGQKKAEEHNKQEENSNSSTVAPSTKIPIDEKNTNKAHVE